MVNSKQKGARGERDFASCINALYGVNARRGQQYCGLAGNSDVICDLPLHIEVKFTERLNLWAAMAQAERDCGPENLPIVAHRKNGEDWVVVVRLKNLGALAHVFHTRRL